MSTPHPLAPEVRVLNGRDLAGLVLALAIVGTPHALRAPWWLALLTLALAIGARRAQRDVAKRALAMDDGQQRAERVREGLRRNRARLADIQAGSERGLWALTRLDDRVSSATEMLARNRLELADQHARLLKARDVVGQLRWILRTLVKMNALRRTVIG